MDNTLPEKRYYSIGEVAAYFGLNASTIRHWETEFPHLRPQTNAKGDRRYTRQDVTNVQEIFVLVKQKGYTLQGAREYLSTNQRQRQTDVVEKLQDIKAFLLELKEVLQNPDKQQD